MHLTTFKNFMSPNSVSIEQDGLGEVRSTTVSGLG